MPTSAITIGNTKPGRALAERGQRREKPGAQEIQALGAALAAIHEQQQSERAAPDQRAQRGLEQAIDGLEPATRFVAG